MRRINKIIVSIILSLLLIIGTCAFFGGKLQVFAEDIYYIYNENDEVEFEFTYDSIRPDFILDRISSYISYELGISSRRIILYVNGVQVENYRNATVNTTDKISYSIQLGSGILKWDGEVDTSWYDPRKEKFYIHTKEELAGLAYIVNYGIDNFKDKVIMLADDIDLSDNLWVPIGKSDLYSFSGIFDGQDFAISGLNFATKDEFMLYGLFGYAHYATFKNIYLDNVKIRINSDVVLLNEPSIASFVAETVCCNLNSIRVEGNIDVLACTGGMTGGVVGYSHLDTFDNIVSDITINANSFNVGGIIGCANNLNLKNAVNLGNITSTFTKTTSNSKRVAGIYSWGSGMNFENVINYGYITGEENALIASIGGYTGWEGRTFNKVYFSDNVNKEEGGSSVNLSLVIDDTNRDTILNQFNTPDEKWVNVNSRLHPKKGAVNCYSINDTGNQNNYSVNLLNAKEGQYIIVSAANGYRVDALEVKDSESNIIPVEKLSNTVYRFEMTSANVTINPTVNIQQFSLGIRANNNYSIMIDGTEVSLSTFLNVNIGETKQIEILPQKGYKIVKVMTSDGRELTLSNNKITLSNILTDTNIIVITERITDIESNPIVGNDSNNDNDAVPTGDSVIMSKWIVIFVMSGLCVLGLMKLYSKKSH